MNRITRTALCFAASLGVGVGGFDLAAKADVAPARQSFTLLKEIPLRGGSSSYDYITFSDGYLYIGHRALGLERVDLRTGVANNVAQTITSNGVAIVKELGIGFSANSIGSITVFRLSDLKVVTVIETGGKIDSVRYDKATNKILAFSLDDPRTGGAIVVVYDAKSLTRLDDIPVAARGLEHAAFDGHGIVYVAAQSRDSVVRIDLVHGNAVTVIPAGCAQPTGLALDLEDQRLMVGCRGHFADPRFVVLNMSDGKKIYDIPIGTGNDGLEYDPVRGRIVLTNGMAGQLFVINKVGKSYAIADIVSTRIRASTLALDDKGLIYTVAAEAHFSPDLPGSKDPSVPYFPNWFRADTFSILIYGLAGDRVGAKGQ